MQKKRKYLVVTIWISTIAFVGAGFVGWGAYNFSASSNKVAKVGDTYITHQSFSAQYNKIYNFYYQIFKGDFNQEKAKSFGLQRQALENLITKTMLINFAQDIGLYVFDDEVGKKILENTQFFESGVFDKSIYKDKLRQAGYSIASYEQSIRDEILIDKLMQYFDISLSDLENESFKAADSIEDSLYIKVFKAKDMQISLSDDDVKKYWESNKEKYLTDKKYHLKYTMTPIDKSYEPSQKELEDFYANNKGDYLEQNNTILKVQDKLISDIRKQRAMKDSIKMAIDLKKDRVKEPAKIVLSYSDIEKEYSVELKEKLGSAQKSNIIKAIEIPNKGFMSLLVEDIEEPKPKAYDDARALAKKDAQNEERISLARAKAKDAIKDDNMKGTYIKSINRLSNDKIDGLEEDQGAKFLSDLFSRRKHIGTISIEDDTVAYRIVKQQFAISSDDDFDKKDTKNNMLRDFILDKLKDRYKVEVFI